MKLARLGLLFILILCGLTPLSEAQPAGRPYRIGVLHTVFFPSTPAVEGLKAGLKSQGLEEGRAVTFEIRFTRGDPKAAPAAVAELVKAGVDLIFVIREEAARAAMAATRTIPIVFVQVGDPVAAGIVAAVSRPGGNVTGVSDLNTELVPKRLEILKALFPAVRRVWAVHHADDLSSVAAARKAQEVAPLLKLDVVVQPVRTSEELVGALKSVRAGDALLFPPATGLNIRGLILDLHLSNGVPTVFGDVFWVKAGGVVSYGSDDYANGVQAARLVAKILRGARPQDLPVEGANKIPLALNLKTARSLGVTIPRELLARADQVIE